MGPAMLLLTLASFLPLQSPPTADVIADIQVHGNVVTPDDEIRQLAGVQIGQSFTSETIEGTVARLRASKRFEQVDVLKRFASIADPSQIVLVIIVDEGPVRIDMTGDPKRGSRVVRKRGLQLLFLPMLRYEDGYGATYGIRVTASGAAGKRSRVSFPVTWGGDKRAAVELTTDVTKDVTKGPFSRAEAGTSISRRTHPFYDQDDSRGRVWLRATRDLRSSWHVSARAEWQHVSFRGIDDSFLEAGPEIIFDTRRDPILARNAVYLRGAWNHTAFGNGEPIARSTMEGAGYLGLFGQTVLVIRVQRDGSNKPLPEYLQAVLGGIDNLRGFKAGTGVGDTLVAGSAELRIPLTSPLRLGKVGVSAFVDVGAVYRDPSRLSDQAMMKGVGGSVWLSVAVLRFSMAVAQGVGASMRVHFGGTLAL
jgi:outer membrane protein assembly factor BamA